MSVTLYDREDVVADLSNKRFFYCYKRTICKKCGKRIDDKYYRVWLGIGHFIKIYCDTCNKE